MKRLIIILSLLVLLIGCLSAQEMKALSKSNIPVKLAPSPLRLPTREAPAYEFSTLPFSLRSSYWDYMIGGYTTLPVRVQSAATGGGIYLTYMGQTDPTTNAGLRRVFYTYIGADGVVGSNNELTDDTIREGYSSVDIDRLSGKPIFAWHTSANPPTDTHYNVAFAWDAYLEGIPGLISEPIKIINYPDTMIVNDVSINDNEFIWPNVQIGPSPLADYRRVYISTTNVKGHTVLGDDGESLPSENQKIAYADFTPAMMENGDTLIWHYTTIPLLDIWNNTDTSFRRPYYSNLVGEDGKYYIVGWHDSAEENVDIAIHEPYLDVWINSNYGEGEWTKYSMNPDVEIPNPIDPTDTLGYFRDDNGTPFPSLRYVVKEGCHMNASLDNNGLLHFPLISFLKSDSTHWYPTTSYMKDVQFNTRYNTFKVCDVYPQSVNPNDGNPAIPWDLDGLGPQFVLSSADSTTYILQSTSDMPYVYWDSEAVDNGMAFNYNYCHLSKMNDNDQMVMVWADSYRAYLRNTYPTAYPELAPFQQVPETYISIYPTTYVDSLGTSHPEYGAVWSEPIVLNSVETPQLTVAGDPMIPEWVYPGDYVEYLGTDADNNRIGRVHLMFYDDNSWGAASIDPAVGQPNGGKVMYTAIDIKWPPCDAVGANDPVVPPSTRMLKQNYPNPFNPTTSISFSLPKSGKASLKIYNIKGQLVKTLVNGPTAGGDHTVVWNGKNDNDNSVSSGIYFYSLKSGSHTETKKMMMVK